MNGYSAKEQIANIVLEKFHKKVRNVYEILDSGVFVVEGNNQSVICHAMLSRNGTVIDFIIFWEEE